MKTFELKLLGVMLLTIAFASCREISNNKNANIVSRDDKIFLVLKGKRKPLVHDPISVITDGLVDDSLLIQLPTKEEGIITGDKIPVREGYYKFKGSISIIKNIVIVNLELIDTDQMKNIPIAYNGTYNLVR